VFRFLLPWHEDDRVNRCDRAVDFGRISDDLVG
jgi:hypothetical protein